MASIRVIPGESLTPELAAAWSRCQQEDPQLDSPFFTPEFTRAVAAVRKDVEIAIWEEEGRPMGFFPFQRTARHAGGPVGGRLSDFHGVIAEQGLDWNAEELMAGCGLRVWHFDHLLCQKPFAPYRFLTAPSPYTDLSAGFEAYRIDCRKRGSHKLHQTLGNARRIEREMGPLRLEPYTTDHHVLDQLIDWKREQYRRTGATDVFAFPWTIAVLERILEERGPAFSGMLSALYVGDRLAALHFGMRRHGVLHMWFPVYNRELANYSPGWIFFAILAKEAQSLGIHRVDWGRGASQMKQQAMNGATEVAEGCVDLSPVGWSLRNGWQRARQRLRASPLRGALQLPARLLRRLRDARQFR